MIYFLQRSDGAIKIGTTKQIQKRIATLQSRHGRLEFLGGLPGGYAEEYQIHSQFLAIKLPDEREWFYSDPSLMDFITGNANPILETFVEPLPEKVAKIPMPALNIQVHTRMPELVLKKSARDGKRYTGKEIAESIGVSTATISRIINGENIEGFTVALLRRICDWLECEIQELIYTERQG